MICWKNSKKWRGHLRIVVQAENGLLLHLSSIQGRGKILSLGRHLSGRPEYIYIRVQIDLSWDNNILGLKENLQREWLKDCIQGYLEKQHVEELPWSMKSSGPRVNTYHRATIKEEAPLKWSGGTMPVPGHLLSSVISHPSAGTMSTLMVTGTETMYEPRLQGFLLIKSDLTIDGTKCPN